MRGEVTTKSSLPKAGAGSSGSPPVHQADRAWSMATARASCHTRAMVQTDMTDVGAPDPQDEESVNGLLALAVASLIGSAVVAAWGICMVTWSLPETDGAYGEIPFTNPVVYPVYGFFVLFAWIATFIVTIFTLRHAPLGASFLCTMGAALVTITVATPFFGFRGALAAFPVTFAGLVYLRLKYRGPTKG